MSCFRKADPERAIAAQIIAALSPVTAALISAKSVAWASATFNGARHEFEFLVTSEETHETFGKFAQTVGDIEFAIGGHIVADIVAKCGEGQSLFVEALSVESD